MQASKLKIVGLETLLEKRGRWTKTGLKLVFTNGCFDMLHLGHIDYLEKASNLGDILVVGVNSDTSVKRLKGQSRPINNENTRLKMLAALGFVDYVVLFEQDTPHNLISDLTPDILVKGSDYEIGNIIGADIVIENGGEVKTIELLNGYSTTSLIEKLKKL